MIVEIFADRDQIQQFAEAVGEPIEYHDNERCGRWRPVIESPVQRNEVVKKIDTLSHRFRLIVQDCGSDEEGPSVFLQPGAEWNAYYRVAVENGRYDLLDEAWECDDLEISDKVPIYRNTVWRFRDGKPCAPLLIIENKDPDDVPSMAVYKCGDNLTVIPGNNAVPVDNQLEQPDRIVPLNDAVASGQEKELVRRFGQWVARWEIGFFDLEGGHRYYIDDPDKLHEKFGLLARTNFDLCLSLWREFDAGYWDMMSEVLIDQDQLENDEVFFWCWRESLATEQPEKEQDHTGTEEVYNRQSWRLLPEFTEEERTQYWDRVRGQEEKEKQERYRKLVEASLGIATPMSGTTPAIVREMRGF